MRSKPETIKPDAGNPDGFEIESNLLSNMLELLALDRLIGFSFKELEEATDNFSQAQRIKNPIFHAILHGKKVALKQMRGQVSKEINALHRFQHTSLVTLLGICVEESSDQDSYFVFEYAENGSLSDYIHIARSYAGGFEPVMEPEAANRSGHRRGVGVSTLTPTCFHKDFNRCNIFLDKNFRAKIANFELAKCEGDADSCL